MIGVDVVRPVPVSVTVWPGLADGSAGLTDVPLDAVAFAGVNAKVELNAVLLPPAVVTTIGPNDSS